MVWGSVPWVTRRLALVCVVLVLLPQVVTAATVATPRASPSTSDAPIPVELPRDDGPHHVSTEWWYYTGHLLTAEGGRYGFELVFFKGERGTLEGYAAHFPVTDYAGRQFHFDQRIVGAEGVSKPGTGFDLTIGSWAMRGANGHDALRAALPGYAIDLRLVSDKPAALHDGDGYIEYGDGTASYYYSRTRLEIAGTLKVGDTARPVTGEA
jgi:predicted secreted hydrolase